MIRRRMSGMSAVALLAAAGCQQGPPKGMSMEDMMKPPPRPVELDKLETFVGSWEGTSECKMMGSDEVMAGHGSSTASWDCDRRVVLEHWDADMGKGDKMHGIGIWTWDPKANKYRNYWFDNLGSTGSGTSTYNEGTLTWHMKTKGTGPMGETVGEGTVKMRDNNSMEWTFSEWNAWKTQKIMEMKGTSRRKMQP